MRISELEKKVILEAVKKFDRTAQVYLYGSRADDIFVKSLTKSLLT